jgi:hypothetical protein
MSSFLSLFTPNNNNNNNKKQKKEAEQQHIIDTKTIEEIFTEFIEKNNDVNVNISFIYNLLNQHKENNNDLSTLLNLVYHDKRDLITNILYFISRKEKNDDGVNYLIIIQKAIVILNYYFIKSPGIKEYQQKRLLEELDITLVYKTLFLNFILSNSSTLTKTKNLNRQQYLNIFNDILIGLMLILESSQDDSKKKLFNMIYNDDRPGMLQIVLSNALVCLDKKHTYPIMNIEHENEFYTSLTILIRFMDYFILNSPKHDKQYISIFFKIIKHTLDLTPPPTSSMNYWECQYHVILCFRHIFENYSCLVLDTNEFKQCSKQLVLLLKNQHYEEFINIQFVSPNEDHKQLKCLQEILFILNELIQNVPDFAHDLIYDDFELYKKMVDLMKPIKSSKVNIINVKMMWICANLTKHTVNSSESFCKSLIINNVSNICDIMDDILSISLETDFLNKNEVLEIFQLQHGTIVLLNNLCQHQTLRLPIMQHYLKHSVLFRLGSFVQKMTDVNNTACQDLMETLSEQHQQSLFIAIFKSIERFLRSILDNKQNKENMDTIRHHFITSNESNPSRYLLVLSEDQLQFLKSSVGIADIDYIVHFINDMYNSLLNL